MSRKKKTYRRNHPTFLNMALIENLETNFKLFAKKMKINATVHVV
jgi:hypothetical protein